MTAAQVNRPQKFINEAPDHDLAEALAEWRHDLDLAGPFAAPEVLRALLDRVPAPAFRDARFLAGRLAGLAGDLGAIGPAQLSRGPIFMAGFTCGLRQAIGLRFGEW